MTKASIIARFESMGLDFGKNFVYELDGSNVVVYDNGVPVTVHGVM